MMSNFKNIFGAALGLIIVAHTLPAAAQDSNEFRTATDQISSWALQENVETKNMTLWAKEEPVLLTRIDEADYARFDSSQFDYSITGPIKFSVGKSYQRRLATNFPSNSDILSSESPTSVEFEIEEYEVTATASLGFDLAF